MLGKLLYQYYHQPKANFRNYVAKGGRAGLEKIRTLESTAKKKCLEEVIDLRPTSSGVKMVILTGKSHWYQSVYLLKSALKYYTNDIHLTIMDDGSMGPAFSKHLRSQVSIFNEVSFEEQMQVLHEKLKVDKYPFIHKANDYHPMNKKLFILRLLMQEYVLYIDSDMLFWNYPSELDLAFRTERFVHMQDIHNSYHYDQDTMANLLHGRQIKPFVNAGLTGFSSAGLDWDKLEFWTKTLVQNQGLDFFIEQALTAMILTELDSEALNRRNYILHPTKQQTKNGEGHLHHYVSLERDWYHSIGIPQFFG